MKLDGSFVVVMPYDRAVFTIASRTKLCRYACPHFVVMSHFKMRSVAEESCAKIKPQLSFHADSCRENAQANCQSDSKLCR
jgi:hypothetical protein